MAPPNDAMPLAELRPVASDPGLTSGRPAPAALQPQLGALLHDVARLIRRQFERRARQTGLPITRHQARVLLCVARNEGVSQAAVATMLDVEPIALVRILDRLHEEGLVERRPHATDRRVRTLWLTGLAWPVIELILAINQSVREEACAELSPAMRDMMMAALAHMKGNLIAAEDASSAEAAARTG
jgi:MarR family transcriptional regulator for hemolysin